MQFRFLTIPLLLYLLIFFLIPFSYAQIIIPVYYENVNDVTDFGAVGDGSHNNQQAVQNCIDEVSRKGGGIVHFPSGHWMTSEIYFKDNVILQFEEKNTITGQIVVRDVKNVGIIGSEDEWVFVDASIRFLNSKNILLKNIFTREDWWPRDCQCIKMENIKVEWPMERQANGDGITFLSCKDVFGSNLDITANDDVWCLKRSAINIHLTNSVLCSRQASSFKIGTEADGNFENISVTNCIFYNSTRAGINIESVDGADISDLYFSAIQMYNVAAPIHINLGYRDRYGTGKMGSIRDITFDNIEYVGMKNEELTGSIGSSINGLPDHYLENITIRNVHFVHRGGGTKEDAHREIPEFPRLYPEFDIFGRLPAYGLYARHVKGLTLENVAIGISNPDMRPALVIEDAENVNVSDFKPQAYIGRSEYFDPITGKPDHLDLHQHGSVHTMVDPPWSEFQKPLPSIRLHQVRGAIIHDNQAPLNTQFLELLGDQTDYITLIGNNLSYCDLPAIKIANEVKGQISFSPLAKVHLSDLQVSNVKANEPIRASVTIQNKGGRGYTKVELMVDNCIVDRRWLWLEKNETTTVELLSPRYYEEATHKVSVGPLSKNIKTIPVEGKFEYTGIELPSVGAVGQSVAVTVNVKNTGSYKKTDSIVLYSNGRELDTKEIILAPGEESSLNFQVSFDKADSYEIGVLGIKKTISINPLWIDKNQNISFDHDESNFATFQDAIDNANEGDCIAAKSGLYEITANELPIRVNKKNLTIKSADGAKNTVIEVQDANEMMRKLHSIFYITADGVKIDGFTLKAGWSNVCIDSAKNCEVSNNYFDFSKRHHIYLDNAQKCIVRDNQSRAALYSFLGMTECKDCIIEGNYHHEDPCGIIVRNSHGNIFRYNHYNGLAWYGITFHGSDDNIIEDNLFEAGRINGLQIRSGSKGNRIIKNTFRNHIKEAILIDSDSKDNQIHNNNIVGNKGLAFCNETPFTIDTPNNWWGSPDGPSGAGDGSGDYVDTKVQYKPWLKTPVKNRWEDRKPVVYHWH